MKLSLGIALAAGAFVACANSDESSPRDTTPVARPLPELDSGAVDGGADAACADADACAAPPEDCTMLDFCSVPFPVSRQTALNAIWGSAPDDIWAVGTRGAILHGDGTSFTPVPTGTNEIFFTVWGTGKSDVWTVAGAAPLHSTGFHDGSATFSPREASSWTAKGGRRVWAGLSTSETGVWVAGDFTSKSGSSGSFWRLSDNGSDGSAWGMTSACPPGQFCVSSVRSLWGTDPANVWAVGPGGQSYRIDDTTTGHFSQLDTKTSDDLLAIWGSSPSDVWAVGASGTIRHTTSATGPWAIAASPTTQTLRALWGSGPSDIWAAGDNGTVLHYDGGSWSVATIGLTSVETPSTLLGIWGSGPDDVWIVGEGLILHRGATNRRRP